ncbi:hypothetical protein MUK42_33806, partial [Musa troglodytarum]
DNGFCNPQASSHPCLIPHHSLSGISPFSRIPESRLLLSLHHPILSTITNIVISNPVLACFPFYWVKATSLDSWEVGLLSLPTSSSELVLVSAGSPISVILFLGPPPSIAVAVSEHQVQQPSSPASIGTPTISVVLLDQPSFVVASIMAVRLPALLILPLTAFPSLFPWISLSGTASLHHLQVSD